MKFDTAERVPKKAYYTKVYAPYTVEKDNTIWNDMIHDIEKGICIHCTNFTSITKHGYYKGWHCIAGKHPTIDTAPDFDFNATKVLLTCDYIIPMPEVKNDFNG